MTSRVDARAAVRSTNRTLAAIAATTFAFTAAACSDDETAGDGTPAPVADTPAPTAIASSSSAAIPATSQAPATTVAPAPSTASPQTTAPPTTTEPPATTAEPNRDGPNWVRIAQGLDDKLVEFYANPPEGLQRIHEVCVPNSPCEQTYAGQLQNAVDRGLRAEGWDRYTVTSAELRSFDGDSLRESFSVVVVVEYDSGNPPYGALVDDDGEIVQEITDSDGGFIGRTTFGRMRRDDGSWGPWRIATWEEV